MKFTLTWRKMHSGDEIYTPDFFPFISSVDAGEGFTLEPVPEVEFIEGSNDQYLISRVKSKGRYHCVLLGCPHFTPTLRPM